MRPSPAPEATREVAATIVRGPGWGVLYDAVLIATPDASWFDASRWEGRVAGYAGRGRGRVLFVDSGDAQWALRHYRRGGLLGRLVADRYLWLGAARTRSFREWRMLARLREAGLPVPRPVAAGWRRRGLCYSADLATETIPDAAPLSARLASGETVDWRGIGRVLRGFHAAGACHADLNAHNILLDAGGAAWVLDFDRGRFRAPGAWQARNLARLERSLRKIAAESGAPAFNAAGWAELQAGYGEARDLRLRLRARGP
jgi:3-deoxy-D-manno-octulosonic acid kinase